MGPSIPDGHDNRGRFDRGGPRLPARSHLALPRGVSCWGEGPSPGDPVQRRCPCLNSLTCLACCGRLKLKWGSSWIVFEPSLIQTTAIKQGATAAQMHGAQPGKRREGVVLDAPSRPAIQSRPGKRPAFLGATPRSTRCCRAAAAGSRWRYVHAKKSVPRRRCQEAHAKKSMPCCRQSPIMDSQNHESNRRAFRP